MDDAHLRHTLCNMKNILEFDSINLMYDTRYILSSVYVKCETGEVVGILGRNGCGKSSLMKIVFGSLSATYKSVRINGNSLPSDHLYQQQISYLPQQNLIPSYITIRRAINLFHVNEDKMIEEFAEIKKILPFKPLQLSGGYRRIIEAMLILYSKAPFCILDEPFSGLMPVHIQKMKDIVYKAKSEKGIIITDHLYREVLSLKDRLYLLSDGKTYLINNDDDLVARGYVPGRSEDSISRYNTN
jgi:ABC-type multidrug transport system ATPase subunit